jgi:glycosyltransferase involved in cell wall biosynthesis
VRILMAIDNLGGVWRYGLELAGALASRGVRTTLAVLGDELDAEQRRELGEVDLDAVFSRRCALEWMDEPWADVDAAGAWLLDLAGCTGAELVHLNGYADAALPWGRPLVVVAHSCVRSWWREVKGCEAPAQFDRYRWAVQRGLDAAHAVVAPTRTMLGRIGDLYGLSPARCHVIGNGLADGARRGPKEPFVLAAGRLWDEAKNLAALDRVAPSVRWPVLVAGEGGEAANVHLLGRLSRRELEPIYARASVFAAPALYEPFGLAALEAGLNRCVLVLGDIPSLREVWGGAALYARGDGGLRRALDRVCVDDALRLELARQARERALHFSAARMADGYLRLYRHVIAHERVAA